MTSTATLTDRYVDAAMRTVPEAQRADLAAELRASIDDQIEARIEQGEQQGDAERAVLIELGDPDRLAAQYTDRPLWLVGPRYFAAIGIPRTVTRNLPWWPSIAVEADITDIFTQTPGPNAGERLQAAPR